MGRLLVLRNGGVFDGASPPGTGSRRSTSTVGWCCPARKNAPRAPGAGRRRADALRDLTQLSTRAEYLDAIARYAGAHPELPWAVGDGWTLSEFGTEGPNADGLSAVVPDRPAFWWPALWAYGEEGRAGSEPFLPEQALTLTEAFAAYTSGSAFTNHLDGTGRLEPGALADLAVLDRDPFAGDPGEVGAARVLRTYVDGIEVFSTSGVSRPSDPCTRG